MFSDTSTQIRQRLMELSGRLDPVSKGWAIVMSGNIGRLLLGFVASILVARALGPADYGIYAVLGAAIAIVGVVADLGLTVTEVKRVSVVWPDQPDIAHLRGRVASWLRLGAALLFFAVAAFFAKPITNLIGISDVSNGTYLFILAMGGMVAVALSGTVSTILQATNHFGRLSSMSLVNAGLTTILAIALSLAGWLNLETALIYLGIGTAIVSFIVGYFLLPGIWSLWRLPSAGDFQQEGASLFHFSRWLWVASLFTVMIMQIDVIMVNRLATVSAAGLYGLALNLSRKADIVNHSLYTALLPAASNLANPAAVGRYIRQSIKRSGLIALGLMILMLFVEPLIRIFYGPEYSEATGLLQLLLVAVIVDAFAIPVILIVFPLERPKLYAASTALQTIILVLLAAWLIPEIGPSGAAIAKIVARIIGLILVIWRLRLWRLSRPDSPS